MMIQNISTMMSRPARSRSDNTARREDRTGLDALGAHRAKGPLVSIKLQRKRVRVEPLYPEENEAMTATTTVAPAPKWSYRCEELIGPIPRRGDCTGLIVLVVREDDGLTLRVGRGGWMNPEDCPEPVGSQPAEVEEAIRLWRMGCAGWHMAAALFDFLNGRSSSDALREEIGGFWRASRIAAGVETLRDERREEWGAR